MRCPCTSTPRADPQHPHPLGPSAPNLRYRISHRRKTACLTLRWQLRNRSAAPEEETRDGI